MNPVWAMVTSLRGESRIPYVKTMLSTANATHAHSLRTLGRLEALWLPLRSDKWVRQGVCQKTRCLVYQTNIESHTQIRTRPTAHCDRRSEVTVIGPLTVGGRGSSDKSRSLSGQDLHSSCSATPTAHTQIFSNLHRARVPSRPPLNNPHTSQDRPLWPPC